MIPLVDVFCSGSLPYKSTKPITFLEIYSPYLLDSASALKINTCQSCSSCKNISTLFTSICLMQNVIFICQNTDLTSHPDILEND